MKPLLGQASPTIPQASAGSELWSEGVPDSHQSLTDLKHQCASSEVWSEALAGASPHSIYHSLENIRSRNCTGLSAELWSETIAQSLPAHELDHGIRHIRNKSPPQRVSSHPKLYKSRSQASLPPNTSRSVDLPTQPSLSSLQANGTAPGGHHGSSVPRLTPHSKHSVPPPPPGGSGNETEDLSGVNFAPPPPPRAQAKPASAPFPFERPMHHASSLPTKLEDEEPGHCTKLEGSEQVGSSFDHPLGNLRFRGFVSLSASAVGRKANEQGGNRMGTSGVWAFCRVWVRSLVPWNLVLRHEVIASGASFIISVQAHHSSSDVRKKGDCKDSTFLG
jgi:hypothetical protein